MKIRGVGRLNKKLNQFKGSRAKSIFDKRLDENFFRSNSKIGNCSIDCTLYSFSGNSQFSDQILCIQSFLKNVGVPKEWVIYSDGTHTKEQLNFFRFYHFIRVQRWDDVSHVALLARDCKVWQLQKYYCYSGTKISGQSIFLDSDVVFFPLFQRFVNGDLRSDNWFLSDTYPCLNDDYLESSCSGAINFINGGFYILNKDIDWADGDKYVSKYLSSALPVPYFTDQTAMEIVFKGNRLKFLDPRLFSLALIDHFTLSSDVKHEALAIRHFVGPIRFRMWQVAKSYDYFCI